MQGLWNMPGIGCENSCSSKRLLRTLEENDNGPREFSENGRHETRDNDEKKTETQCAEDSHGNNRDG